MFPCGKIVARRSKWNGGNLEELKLAEPGQLKPARPSEVLPSLTVNFSLQSVRSLLSRKSFVIKLRNVHFERFKMSQST